MVLDAIGSIKQQMCDLSAGIAAVKTASDDSKSFRRRQIDGLKSICKTAWGISAFARQNLNAISGDKTSAESLCRRLDYLMKSICELLNANGVSVIAPQKHEEVSPVNHRVVAQDEPSEGDAVNTISQCWEIGFIQDGVVSPAEVTVFKSTDNQ